MVAILDLKMADQLATTVSANIATTVIDMEEILAAIPMFPNKPCQQICRVNMLSGIEFHKGSTGKLGRFYHGTHDIFGS